MASWLGDNKTFLSNHVVIKSIEITIVTIWLRYTHLPHSEAGLLAPGHCLFSCGDSDTDAVSVILLIFFTSTQYRPLRSETHQMPFYKARDANALWPRE